MNQKCPLGQADINHICREIIDGQQRLTTILLWIQALMSYQVIIDAASPLAYTLTPFYLQKPNNDEFELIKSGSDVSRNSDLLSKVYMYFLYLLWHGEGALTQPDALSTPTRRKKDEPVLDFWQRWVDTTRERDDWVSRSARPDCKRLLELTINNLSFLGIKIADEEPERVFAALNGNRTELSQFDHLRNFVFSSVDISRRDGLFDDKWQPGEAELESLTTVGGQSKDILKARFLYDYLISIGEGSFGKFNASRSFATFAKFCRSSRLSTQGFSNIEDWLSSSFGDQVSLWSVQREKFLSTNLASGKTLKLTAASRRSLNRIRMASDGPPSPLVLWILRRSLLDSADPKSFDAATVEVSLRALEGFLFKTLLGGQSLTNFRSEIISSMGKIDLACVAAGGKAVHEPLLDKLRSLSKVSWVTLKGDLENMHNLDSERGIYILLGSNTTRAVLDAIDESYSGPGSQGFLKKVFAYDEDPFWVEHIFPIKWKKTWKRPLTAWGIDPAAMDARLHVLGNLTALPSAINQDISNKPLSEKVAVINDDATASATKLQSWLSESQWTPALVDTRTHEFVVQLTKIWPDI